MRPQMTRIQVRDLVERAAFTAAEGFLAGWAVTNFQFTKGALIGGLAAALSALKTFILVNRP